MSRRASTLRSNDWPYRDTLSSLFEEPPCRVAIGRLPDDAPCCAGDAPMLVLGLLHDAEDLRVGRLDVHEDADPEDAHRWWLGLGEDPEYFPGGSGFGGMQITHLPIILARERGAWVVVVCGRDDELQRAAEEAVEDRAWLVDKLCATFGWAPADVPLGATVLLLERDPAPHESLAVPTRDVVGRSDLWRLAARLRDIPVGPAERRGTPLPAATLERFFEDLASLGTFERGDGVDLPIELPGWMLRRPS